ncbi:MAG: hypothetical protein Kow0080_31020 [Candidatus Promineifilaceae bacterium]
MVSRQAISKVNTAVSPPPVTILILNYNSMRHLPDNLASLAQLNYPPDKIEILLADNASTDDSLSWVQTNYPHVRIIQNGRNLGFAAGNNAGIKAATHEWVAILNPDTRVHPDWLRELVRPVLQDPAITAVAAKMLTWDGTAIDFADAALNFMGWGNQPGLGSTQLDAFNTPKPLLFACGGAMLIHRDTFLQLGGFDPDYFAYFEDVDLGWRLALAGHTTQFAPNAIVYHRHHGSWEGVAAAKKWLLSERNTLATIIKNYDDANLARILPAALLLLLQRAYLDVRPDSAIWGLPTRKPLMRYLYFFHSQYLLAKHGRFPEVMHSALQKIQQRIHNPAKPTKATPLPSPTQTTHHHLPATAASRLLAASDLYQQWPHLMTKRQTIQAMRARPDQDIFSLFQSPLLSNFGENDFIYAMTQATTRFKLTNLFLGHNLPPITDETRALSTAVSRQLLHLIHTTSQQSSILPTDFEINKTTPRESYPVPAATVALLAYANYWLWHLPRGPLEKQLHYLQTQLNQWENHFHAK